MPFANILLSEMAWVQYNISPIWCGLDRAQDTDSQWVSYETQQNQQSHADLNNIAGGKKLCRQ